MYVRQGLLTAQRLDLERGELTGDPETLADAVDTEPIFSRAGFSVSADGQVAYRAGGAGRSQLSWYDRTGKAVGVAGEPDVNSLQYVELSPDGRRVAVDRLVQGNRDVWLMDLERGGMTRFTFDAALDQVPLWSPDGMRIVFRSTRKGPTDLYVKPSNGAGTEELLLETPNGKTAQDWSGDGRFLLYSEQDPKTAADLKALPMSGANASPAGRSNQEMSGAREAQARQGDAVNNASPAGRSLQEVTGNERKPVMVVNMPFDERLGQFSPDARWVA